MSAPFQTLETALQYECPWCGAVVGAHCVGESPSEERFVHGARIDAAQGGRLARGLAFLEELKREL